MPSAGELQISAIHGSLWTGLATAIAVPLGLAGTIIAARVLGPDAFGKLALLLFVFPLLVSALDLGFAAVTNWVIASNSVGDRRLVYEAVSMYVSWSLIKLLVLVIAGAAVIGAVSIELFLYGVITAGYLYLSVAQLALYAERRFKTNSLLNLIGTATSTVALVGAALMTHDYGTVFLARIGGQLAIVPFIAAALERGVFRASLRPGRIRLPSDMRRYATASYVSYISSLWVFGRSETIFLNRAGLATDLGRFSAATTVSARTTLLSDALYTSLESTLVALQGAHGDVIRRAFVRMTRFGCIVGIATAVAVMPLAVILAPSLFGSEYEGLSGPIAVLAVASIVWTSVGPLTAWVTATRNVRGMMIPTVTAAAVDAAIAAIFCPIFGLRGAVAASVTATAVMLVGLIVVGADDREGRMEVIRCVAYVTLIGALAAVTCVGTQPFGLVVGIGGAYMLIVATSFILLRLVFPPIADRNDLDAVGRAVPTRYGKYVTRVLGPVFGLPARAD